MKIYKHIAEAKKSLKRLSNNVKTQKQVDDLNTIIRCLNSFDKILSKNRKIQFLDNFLYYALYREIIEYSIKHDGMYYPDEKAISLHLANVDFKMFSENWKSKLNDLLRQSYLAIIAKEKNYKAIDELFKFNHSEHLDKQLKECLESLKIDINIK